MWTQEQINKARQRAYEAAPDLMDLTDTAVSALMTRAVEFVQALGGTMEPGTLEGDLLTIASRPERLPDTARRLRQHMVAQGATVATLRAKVAEWERKAMDAEHHPAVQAFRKERDALRAEVERLKAQVERLTAAGQVLSEHVDKAIDGPEDPRPFPIRSPHAFIPGADGQCAAPGSMPGRTCGYGEALHPKD